MYSTLIYKTEERKKKNKNRSKNLYRITNIFDNKKSHKYNYTYYTVVVILVVVTVKLLSRIEYLDINTKL